MEDFTCLALEKVLTGFFPLEAYRDIGFSRGPDRRGEGLPARRGGPERLRGVPEVLQARHARLDGEQPRAHRAPDRARAARGCPRSASSCPPRLARRAATPPADRSSVARSRRARGRSASTAAERRRHAGAVAKRVRRRPRPAAPQRRQPVGHPVLHPGAARPSARPRALREPVAMLPARERPADLRVHEAVGRVELADRSRASVPGSARRTRKSSTAPAASRGGGGVEPARAAPTRDWTRARLRGIGEEREHLGARAAAATRGARGCSPPWRPRYHRRVPDPGQTRAYLALTLISGALGLLSRVRQARPRPLPALRAGLAALHARLRVPRRAALPPRLGGVPRAARGATCAPSRSSASPGSSSPPAAPTSASRSAPRPTRPSCRPPRR